jgi:hypothetical protein
MHSPLCGPCCWEASTGEWAISLGLRKQHDVMLRLIAHDVSSMDLTTVRAMLLGGLNR